MSPEPYENTRMLIKNHITRLELHDFKRIFQQPMKFNVETWQSQRPSLKRINCFGKTTLSNIRMLPSATLCTRNWASLFLWPVAKSMLSWSMLTACDHDVHNITMPWSRNRPCITLTMHTCSNKIINKIILAVKQPITQPSIHNIIKIVQMLTDNKSYLAVNKKWLCRISARTAWISGLTPVSYA